MSGYNAYSGNRGGGNNGGYVQDSFNGDQSTQKKPMAHTLRPVTIKQLTSATQTEADNDFRIDNQEIGQITFIGAVRQINQQSTQHTFTIEDGTGFIDAKKFSPEEDAADLANITEGMYVRVIGLLKQFNNRFSVNVHSIRPIESMDELTYHNLEVVFVHVSTTRSKMGGGAMGSSSSTAMNASYNQPSHMAAVSSVEFPQQIAQFLVDHPNGKLVGVHRQEIVSRFASAMGSPSAVLQLLEDMVTNGLLFTGDSEDQILVAY